MARYIRLGAAALAKLPPALLVPCPGEAHTTIYIDHCMLCAPRWGYMACCPTCIEDGAHPRLLELHSHRMVKVAEVGTCRVCGTRYRVKGLDHEVTT